MDGRDFGLDLIASLVLVVAYGYTAAWVWAGRRVVRRDAPTGRRPWCTPRDRWVNVRPGYDSTPHTHRRHQYG
jgi:hypothetical protein